MPVPADWEPIDRGGYLGPGPCGHLHLYGRRWVQWRCPHCADLDRECPHCVRQRTTARLRLDHDYLMDLFYPDEEK